MKTRTLIVGAAGRDFHNFNTYFRANEGFEVVGFTASKQIPGISGREYPGPLAGRLYPEGIPIYHEKELSKIISDLKVDAAVFSYSDITHNHVMHLASHVLSVGADFLLLGAESTMLKSKRDVISVTAVRTGSGKSQTTREICRVLIEMKRKVVAVRHPMPYGDLKSQIVQRFASYSDFEDYGLTIEEREEYEPLVEKGIVVYAGVDYGRILERAEEEADIIVWDGGNNDTSFFSPDLAFVVFDPHRAGHELLYHPGEVNLLLSDIAVINKVDTAREDDIETVKKNIEANNPRARIIYAASPVSVDKPEAINNRRVLVVEDGPTVTHGEMKFGAGKIAAEKYGAKEIVDPRPFAVGTIKETYNIYPMMGNILPAMGYSDKQRRDLEETINSAECDLVVSATPIDLLRLVEIKKPVVRVRYSYEDAGELKIDDVLRKKFGI